MKTSCTWIAILFCAVRLSVAAECDPADMARWQEKRGVTVERLATIDTEMSELSTALRKLALQIDEEKARERAGGRFSRRKLERLLKDSRSMARRLEGVASQKKAVEAERDRVGSHLRDCYSRLLTSSLEAMVAAVRDKQFDTAAAHLHEVRELELRIAELQPPRTEASYPTISEDFIRSALPSFEERAFLLDTMMDLQERAERDSTAIGRQLADVRKSLSLKEDLLRLIEEASAGADGGTFFDEFGRDRVVEEIQELKREEERLLDAFHAAVNAIRYYRERTELLNELVGEKTG